MGFLDKLRSSLGLPRGDERAPAPESARAAPTASARPEAKAAPAKSSGPLPFLGPAKPPEGPLRLAAGDAVTLYRERFSVTGVRTIDGDGVSILHYCLRDANGGAAILSSEGGKSFSLERAVVTDAKWDSDTVAGVADEPMALAAKGKAKVRVFGECGVPATVRSVTWRTYADAAGDRTLHLDDFDGTREARLGEPVFEAEMEFERATALRAAGARTAALAEAAKFEEVHPDAIVKGSPRAAAKALEAGVGRKDAAPRAEDKDPTAYDDERWDDGDDASAAKLPAIAATPKKKNARRSAIVDDDDEWVSATQLVRENGEEAGDEDEIDARRRAKK